MDNGAMDPESAHRLEEWRAAVSQHLNNPGFAKEPKYLYDPMCYALKAEGKMLRPALCFAAAEAVGGNWQDALKAGVALEIFHTFTLIHDDIMDGDDLRRGRPTVHKAYDTERALLAGDTLFVYVYQLLAENNAEKFPALFQAFNAGAMEVCLGQGWDMQFGRSPEVLPEEYQMMIDLKTGALIKLACEMGAISGGGNKTQIEALSRFGLLLGRAFQMQDDLLEVTSSAETMGKSLGSDVLNEKKTWIWLDLKKDLNEAELARWKAIQSSGELTDENRKMVHEWMLKHGTIKRAQTMVQEWISRANTLLDGPLFQDPVMLKSLVSLILERKK